MAAVVTRCHPFPDITPSLFLPLVRVRFSVVVSFHPDNTRAHKVEGRKSGERNSLFLFLILSLFFYFRFWLASKKEGLGSGFHHEKCVAPLRSKEQNKTKRKEYQSIRDDDEDKAGTGRLRLSFHDTNDDQMIRLSSSNSDWFQSVKCTRSTLTNVLLITK